MDKKNRLVFMDFPRFNWTGGCLAVSNRDMDEIWQAVDTGTSIEIRP
jgi:L,D-peptidoglycan transpeptidase YkuD (ErfK/YbiS/YcfS/YnhG family)